MKLDYDLTIEQAKEIKRTIGKSKIIAEYEKIIKDTPTGKAGRIILEKNDKPNTIKNRLRKAAQNLKIEDFKIKRVGKTIAFWSED